MAPPPELGAPDAQGVAPRRGTAGRDPGPPTPPLAPAVAQTWNVLPLDSQTFRVWAKLMHGRSDDLLVDALIAASALTHHLVVVTRNVSDFASLEVETLNPFETPARG